MTRKAEKRYTIRLTAGQIGHLKAVLRMDILDVESRQRAFAGQMTTDQEQNLREVKECSQAILVELEKDYWSAPKSRKNHA